MSCHTKCFNKENDITIAFAAQASEKVLTPKLVQQMIVSTISALGLQDDIIITGIDSSQITSLQQQLKYTFHMKDVGKLTYFLGLEVHNVALGVFLTQHKYVQDLISLDDLQDYSSVDTPMELNMKYRCEEGDILLDPTMFRQLVRSINYLTITLISFAVRQVSQFMQAPRHLHLVVVHRIIRYLLRTSTCGLFFPSGSTICLYIFSDSDWARCPDTRPSVTGWCIFLGGSLISLKSKKQDRVSNSSTENEYRSMSTACSKVVWI
nr:uncharacterized protein LOC109118909 [Solanum lycopersicum]